MTLPIFFFWLNFRIVGEDDGGVMFTPEQYEAYKKRVLPMVYYILHHSRAKLIRRKKQKHVVKQTKGADCELFINLLCLKMAKFPNILKIL